MSSNAIRRERSLADILAAMKQDSRVSLTSRKIPDNAKLNYIRSVLETAPISADSATVTAATAPYLYDTAKFDFAEYG